MKTSRIAAALCSIALAAPGLAQQGRRNGDHPAVVVQRLDARQGYDYASKFYPHPAWLYLYAEAPAPTLDAKRDEARTQKHADTAQAPIGELAQVRRR